MKGLSYILCLAIVLRIQNSECLSQENLFTHYFASLSQYNPAFAGDTRFSQIQLVNRIQPQVTYNPVYNTSLSYNQKIPNQHSGVQLNINQKLSIFRELQLKLSYSYTAVISRKTALKGGLGIAYNSINTYSNSYKYPDQFDDNGYTGLPTGEPAIEDKSSYPSFSAGITLYTSTIWVSAGADNLNRPAHEFAGEAVHEPLTLAFSGGCLFPLDKDKRAKRIFSHNGGLEPYSSLGPVISYFTEGPFHEARIGINAFTNPVFWGAVYRVNTYYGQEQGSGIQSVNLMAGYRNDFLSIAYSFDVMLNRTPTNYKGAHEVSLIFYFYSIKEDYKRHPLVPFPNQLMF